MSHKQHLLVFLCAFLVVFRAVPSGHAAEPSLGASPNAANSKLFVCIPDESGSMHDKLRPVLGSLELAAAILDGRLQAISFSDQAHVSPVFDLASQRDQFCQWSRSIGRGGGTNYLPPLKAIPADAVAAVLITDGEPSEPPGVVLDYLRQRPAGCRIYTIGIQAGETADRLLADIAAATSASYFRVQHGSEAVTALLSVLADYRQYRQFESKDGQPISIDVQGEFLVIGYGAAPLISGGQPQRRAANLPDGEIHIARVFLPKKQAVRIAPAPNATDKRVTVIRFDLSRSKMVLKRVGDHNGQMHVKAETEFFDAENRRVDPRGSDTLKSAFQVIGPDGKVVQTVLAEASKSDARLESLLAVPIGKDGSPFVVRNLTAESSSNRLFQSSESRAVSPDSLPRPQVSITTAIRATCRGPGQPLEIEAEVIPTTGSAEAFRLIMESLQATPPVLEVTDPGGNQFSSDQHPAQFRLEKGRVEQAVFKISGGFLSVNDPGEYRVHLKSGSAAGFPYAESAAVANCIAADQVQLIIAAMNRRAGRTVLVDSRQDRVQPALVGDALSCEIIRGTMDAKIFAGLEHRLYAEFIGEDGAVQRVSLKRNGDRFVTDAVVIRNPGILTVHVNLAMQGTQISLTGQLDVLEVQLRLVLRKAPLFSSQGIAPKGALVPLEVGLEGQTRKGLATRQTLEEILPRGRCAFRWLVTDSTGEVISSDSAAASFEGWKSVAHVERTGRHTFALELLSGGRIAHRLAWEFESVEPAIVVEVFRRGDSAPIPPDRVDTLATYLPSIFVRHVPCVAKILSAKSPIAGTHYLAAARIGGAEAVFNDEQGAFVVAVDHPVTDRCVGRLDPLARGQTPEIQVVHDFSFTPPVEIVWTRVAWAAAIFLAGVLVARWSVIWLRSNPRDRIAVLTPVGDFASLPLTTWRGLLGLRESLIIPDDLPQELQPIETGAKGGSAGTDSRRLLRIYRPWFSRAVVATALTDDVPGLARATSIKLGRAGEPNISSPDVRLSDGTVVSFEYEEEEVPAAELA